MNSYKKIIDKYFGKCEVVSFDIFDTLIKRDIGNPSDVFDVVQERYNWSHDDKIVNFKNKRIWAEVLARGESSIEVTLEQIYSRLDLNEELKTELMQIEIDTEKFICRDNTMLHEIYDWCLEQGKKVVLISDMYLSINVIIEILKNAGYEKYHKLYLSSEIGAQKSKGTLFSHVIKDLGVGKWRMLHIGDNRRADIKMPLKNKICVLPIKKDICHIDYLTCVDVFKDDIGKYIFPFINNRHFDNLLKSEGYCLGYEILGPIIYGFCQWLHEIKRKSHIDKLFFLARDAYIMKLAYDKMYGEYIVDNEYVCVSRKSLRFPYIAKYMNLEGLAFTLPRKNYSLFDLANSLDLDTSLYNIRDYDIHFKKGRKNDYQADEVTEKYFEQIKSDLVVKANEQANLFYEYIEQFSDRNSIGLVDVGWHGTIQTILERLDTDLEFHGLYCGHVDKGTNNRGAIHSFWFDSREDEQSAIDLLRTSILFERMILIGNSGTTVGYRKNGDKVEPKFGKAEQYNSEYIKEIQNGALKFVEEFHQFNKETMNIKLPSKIAFKSLEKMAYNPNIFHAHKFGDMEYEDVKIVFIAKPKKICEYFFKPRSFVKDYKDCRWKEGFIKRVFPLIKNPHSIVTYIGRFIQQQEKIKNSMVRKNYRVMTKRTSV